MVPRVVQKRAERKLERTLAGGQQQVQLMPRGIARGNLKHGTADNSRHALGIGKPGRLAVQRTANVLLGGRDRGQRGGVGIDDVPIRGQQVLVLEAGFEQRLQAAFTAVQGRGAFADPRSSDSLLAVSSALTCLSSLMSRAMA